MDFKAKIEGIATHQVISLLKFGVLVLDSNNHIMA